MLYITWDPDGGLRSMAPYLSLFAVCVAEGWTKGGRGGDVALDKGEA